MEKYTRIPATIVFMFVCIAFSTSAFVSIVQEYVYTSTEGKMTVTFPAAFESISEEKGSMKTVKTKAIVDDKLFFAAYTVHSEVLTDRESLAEVSLNSFHETIGGTITGKSVWEFEGSNGLIATINLDDQDINIQYQAIIIGNIQYQIVLMAPKTTWDQTAANVFFKSFKVTI